MLLIIVNCTSILRFTVTFCSPPCVEFYKTRECKYLTENNGLMFYKEMTLKEYTATNDALEGIYFT